jgi:hypothetical protein
MKLLDIIEGKSENRELWDKIRSKGVVPGFDKEKYQPRSGLEGPFRLRNGKVVYYDPQEGSYYDPDTDLYISYDDYKKMDEEADLPNKKPAGYYVMRNGQSISYHRDKESAEKRARTANMRGGSNATVVKDDRGVKEEADDVGAQIADLIRKKNSVSSPIARKNIDSQIALLKRKRDKTNEEQGVAEGDKRPKYVVTTKDKPKIVKPSMGGESPHPYQGKLVGATESSQWGEPEDVLRQVLQTLEREVEWPLTDVMDPQQVKQLLSPLMQAVSQKLNSLDEAEVSNTDYEFTHGKKPGGQGSWFFVAHRGGINFSKDVEGEDYVELHGMSYSDAKKAAVKWAKSKGHTSLFVAT